MTALNLQDNDNDLIGGEDDAGSDYGTNVTPTRNGNEPAGGAGASAGVGAGAYSNPSSDPYGQLGDLEFVGSGGGYQTDMPRPRKGAEEDLLF